MLGLVCPEMQHTRQQPPACRQGGGAPSGSFCAQCSGDTQNEKKPSTTPSSLPLLRVSDQRQTPVFGTNQGGQGGRYLAVPHPPVQAGVSSASSA